ncbi:hypothetical protein DPMN_142761 [Dreissena polymorpha]|uniref:Uncharacterized protein n=1 Tax=Dreissena polymorpha TaxID=45954 RepID=A0A9D3Y713_DREPO|nr:hypothetical protein DPMN_193356 [Dreissena polymorpha]KAH3814267.1 hypothetical protein DPMN_142761 [Dreissena polymorpha]
MAGRRYMLPVTMGDWAVYNYSTSGAPVLTNAIISGIPQHTTQQPRVTCPA